MTLEGLNQHLELREKLDKAEEMLAALRAAATPGAAKLTRNYEACMAALKEA